MRYWDTSGLVPLFAHQAASSSMQSRYGEDEGLTVWWGTSLEVESALARLSRDSTLAVEAVDRARGRLEELARSWVEVGPSEKLRDLARRLVRIHPLRAADALQLAAALVACEQRPEVLPFVCLDERLGEAARLEGFRVLRGPARAEKKRGRP